jgi:hypothetical protein
MDIFKGPIIQMSGEEFLEFGECRNCKNSFGGLRCPCGCHIDSDLFSDRRFFFGSVCVIDSSVNKL